VGVVQAASSLAMYPRPAASETGAARMSPEPALDTNQLNSLPRGPDSTKGFFKYKPLSASESPPSDQQAHYCLARRETGEDEEGGRLRLAFATGYDADANWLDCLSYVWREESSDVVWALERWENAEDTLGLYTLDPDFEKDSLDSVHERLQDEGDDGVAQKVRGVLGES
jgi:hypothetical protein